ncbi:hypothetical protein F5880DRAFT_1478625, partial [Lentinula raphanica]
IRAIAIVITAICRGDITKKLEIAVTGEMLDLKVTINAMVDQLGLIAGEVNRAVLEVATQSRMYLEELGGSWKELQDNVNEHLLCQMNEVRALSEMMRAIHQGKLDTYFDLEAQGEMLDLKDTVNSLVAQLSKMANEVIQICHKTVDRSMLGKQSVTSDFEGDWKMLVDGVNSLANLAATGPRPLNK